MIQWQDDLVRRIARDALLPLGADVQQDSVYPNPRMSGSQLTWKYLPSGYVKIAIENDH